jgi:hypothetical protein
MVTLKINGLKEYQAQIKALPAALEKRGNAIIQNNLLEMARNAKADAPVDMGRLKNAISVKQNKPLDWSLVCQAAYAVYIEFGTKGRYQPIPGVDPSEFKGAGGTEGGKGFYDSILEWVQRNHIVGTFNVATKRREGSKLDKQIEDEQTAFAIYLSIIRHGIKPHPFFFKQGPRQEAKIYADFNQLLNEQRL